MSENSDGTVKLETISWAFVVDNGDVTIAMEDIVDVNITSEDSVAVVAFKASSISDVEGIANASKYIKDFVDEKHPTRLIFDFGGVKFFSSLVLGVLLEIRSKLASYNGEVVISAISPQLHKVFKITNLDKIFTFFPDKEAAVSAVSN
jgi:anti-sigma B factor antagonist